MKGLIIAAGKGSRITSLGSPKPLIPLLGVPLIERVIGTGQQHGIDHFYVVTGHESYRIHLFLEQLSTRLEMPITALYNSEWQQANGLSVLRAADVLQEPFVLLMSDHMLEGEVIARLIRTPLGTDHVVLAVDYGLETNQLVDLEDVTKVLVESERIVDIGKVIPQYNAYDTGAFLCSPALFEAVRSSVAEDGDCSLSGAIRQLTRQRKARTLDIGDLWWIDVDNIQDFHRAEELLRPR